MKIGDRIRSTKIRPDDIAEITKSEIDIKRNKKKSAYSTRTEYRATYSDGSQITFYGFDIGQSIFKVEDDGQMSLADFGIDI